MTRKSKPPIAIYSALADATRCRIVEILLAGPIPVHTLANAFSISRPAISRHLRVLKTAGLVAEVKKGRENLYALRPARLAPATAWISAVVAPASASAEPPPVRESAPAVPTIPAAELATLEPVAEASRAAVPASEASDPIIVSVPDAVQALPPVTPRQKAERTDKTARAARPEPAANQMGFDF
jgi:DNA-binding transcriptional ArsR family regulator